MIRRILLVDDEEDFCHFVKLNLEKTGKFEIAIANNGAVGLEMAKDNPPDLILLDLLMPVMDGSEVAENLLKNPVTKNIPIIFVTALTRKKEVDSHYGTIGGRTFIAKPIAPNELMAHIEKFMEQ
ncbi:MAG: response regulator [Candidatus Saelkia tenebricola]|nr:response regulator [Candidatus Saelkia tenebricola]